jgi:hypothetical protein
MAFPAPLTRFCHPLAPATVTLYLALMFASVSYRHCLETERLLMKDIRNPELSPRDRAICANALDRILKRKRLLRRKPAPKPVDADKYQENLKKRRQVEAVSFNELKSEETSVGSADQGFGEQKG